VAILIEPFAQAFFEHSVNDGDPEDYYFSKPPIWSELDAVAKENWRISASKILARYSELALAPPKSDK